MKLTKKAQFLVKMGGCVAALVCFTGVESANAVIDFTGDFDPGNWTFTNTNADGFVNTTNAPTSITLTGGDNGSSSAGTTDYTITAPNSETVSFSWDYTTTDIEGPFFDPFVRLLNGVATQLTSNGGANNQSGTDSFNVNAGDIFGFRIATLDNDLGIASVTISDFATSSSVAVPFEFSPTLGLLLVGGLLASNHLYRQHKAKKVVLDSEV